LLALVALPRLLVFGVNQNLGGDAIARVWLAHRWLEAPHVIGSFDQGAMQFGPLHIYLLALAEWCWPNLLDAGRVVSLLAGVATTVPLFALTRRLFGEAAATWACVALAWWGLHVQCSTTAASEATSLLLVLAAVERYGAWAEGGSREALLGCALALNLACATRYDAWLLVPLLVAAALVASRSWRLALAFGAASSAFAVAWSFGNLVDRGDPLFPFRFIDAFHRAWYPSEEAVWGKAAYRALCLGFWPGAALLTLTPPVALAGLVGLVRAWRAGTARWLVALVVVPTAMFAFRSAVLGSFAPLARFTVKELVLLLPFVWFGARPLARWSGSKWAVGASVVLAVGWCAALGLFCFRSTGTWQNTLRAVSATSTLDVALAKVTARLTPLAGGTGVVVVDEDPRAYDDLIISYFSGFEYRSQARRRSPFFTTRLASGPVRAVVRFEGGRLEREGRFVVSPPSFDGVALRELDGVAAPVHLYVRD
jgi:hypothetical protein